MSVLCTLTASVVLTASMVHTMHLTLCFFPPTPFPPLSMHK